jgi:GST-like protein
MIDLHYAPTPNGWKISIMLEELGLPYRVLPVNIRAGEQFRPEFLAISPNNRIPAIVDRAPGDGGEPFSVFEDRGDPDLSRRQDRAVFAEGDAGTLPYDAMADVADKRVGPMLGQHGHFARYAAEQIPYAIERYRDEAARPLRRDEDRETTKETPCSNSSSIVPVPGPISPFTTSSRSQRSSASRSIGGRSWSAASSTP